MPTSAEFKELVLSYKKLEEELTKNPNLINEQDEDGQSLLHHAARLGTILGQASINTILNVLFKEPGINFNLKDNNGDTPLHIAALYCVDRVTCQYVFPTLVRKAASSNFDFSTLGQHGKSVLQIATTTTYSDHHGRTINNVQNVLGNTDDPGINTLSSSGSTAFFYAVNQCRFTEANALLDAGANPLLCGSKERDPLAQLKEHLTTFQDALSDDNYAGQHEAIQAMIEPLTALTAKVERIASEQSHAEIRKAARILAQGKRTGALFSHLPDELLAKIASHTGNPRTHTEDEADQIANDHLGKPS